MNVLINKPMKLIAIFIATLLVPALSFGQVFKFRAYKTVIGSIINDAYKPSDSSVSDYLVLLNLDKDQVVLYANQQEDKYDIVKVDQKFYDYDSSAILPMVGVNAKGQKFDIYLTLYHKERADTKYSVLSVGKIMIAYSIFRIEAFLRQND
jgi:hypothetical protein